MRRRSWLPAAAVSIIIVFAASAVLPAESAKSQHHTPAPASPRATTSTLPRFSDVAQSSGVQFHLTCGGAEKSYIMESMCGGIAVFDYDDDGWMDIFLLDGSTLADMKSGVCHSGKLYHNNHDGTFTDVTAKSGLTRCGWGFGVAVGDYDNDGRDDLYLTYLDGAALFHNNGDGTFSDVTSAAGVSNGGSWGTSAAFGDYDNDGRLDLYIANYVDLDLAHLPALGSSPFCQYRGIPVSCGPRGLKGARDRLYHNNGNGTFTDVTNDLGIDPDGYYGLGVLWLDYDKDGCLDLFVADDSSPSLLYHNDCHGRFTERGAQAGVAYSSDGLEQAGMGVDSADYDNDGLPDVVKINFSDDANNLYHNDGGGSFTDLAGSAGFGPVSIPFLGFGVKFFEIDNDGWPDIFVANGHVNPQVDGQSFGVTYAERPLLFHNASGRFDEIGLKSGSPFTHRYVARGLAVGDFGNHGRQDLLVSVLDGSPLLLQRTDNQGGHWLRIRTIGVKSNRDGFGARVEVKAGGRTQYGEVRSNSSFESASDPRLHFGLGKSSAVESVVVRWPAGTVDTIGPQPADREITIREGTGLVTAPPR